MPTFAQSMKYLLFGFCLAVAFSARAFGQADAGDGYERSYGIPILPEDAVKVEGVIKSDTTWSGHVRVLGDVLVPEGVTLTIEQGTLVLFAESDSTKIEPMFLSMQTELLVRGTLLVNVAGGYPVRFSPAGDTEAQKAPERGDWGGLIFDGEAASKSIVKRAIIEKADTGVASYKSSPTLEGCRIADSRYGVVAADGAAPVLSGCRVVGGEFGVVTYRDGKPALDGCTVEGNEHDFLTRD